MGLFDFAKKQLLSVIEWNDNSKDTIVYRYPLKDRDEIMNSSTLVVRPSQIALFVHKGQICDVFAPGTYKLATENIPIITKLLSLPTGFNSTIKAEIYYVNTKQMTGIKWGTQNPILLRDKDFGNIRIRAFGVYSYKVDNAKKFMEEVFGTNEIYKTKDLSDQIKPMVLQSFSDAVAESKISALDLASNYKEFTDTIIATSKSEFERIGLKLCSMVIENISFPEAVEKALDERTTLGVMEDKMGTYTQYQAAQALRDAAKNPGGGNLAGLGVGLGAGVGIGNVFTEALQGAKNKERKPQEEAGAPAPSPVPSTGTKVCPKCNAVLSAKTKFCPECGEKQVVARFCPNCGVSVTGRAKFCPECGEKL